MSTPRAHHYVPRTYLSGFLDPEGRLFVIHKDSGKVRPSKPGREAHERDYYRLEGGNDALAIEKFFAEFEGRWPEVRAATLEARGLPERFELRALLMGFMAVQAIRVPAVIDGWDKLQDQLMKRVSRDLVASPEVWAAHVERMREAGDPVLPVSYEQMRDYVVTEEYTVTLDQNSRLVPLIKATPAIAQALSERTWTLVEAEDEAPSLLASDRPMAVCWNEPATRSWPPPGLAGCRSSRSGEQPQ